MYNRQTQESRSRDDAYIEADIASQIKGQTRKQEEYKAVFCRGRAFLRGHQTGQKGYARRWWNCYAMTLYRLL